MIRHTVKWLYQVLWMASLIVCVGVLVYLFTLPDVSNLETHNPTRTSLMELRENQARAAGRTLHSDLRWLPILEMSPNLVHAALISEDDTFYQHKGIDWAQVQEALRINWQKRRFAYGGSTITQQLARTLYLSPRKNLLRKAKEALITLQLERHLSKERILEIYLNVVEWGKGIYGAEAASQAYFHKSAADLTPDEAVSLVSILPSPRRWNPLSEKAYMARRRTQLIDRMRREGYLPQEQSEETAIFNLDQLQGTEFMVQPDSATQP